MAGETYRSLPVKRDGEFCYSIVLGQDFGKLSAEAQTLGIENRKICIVTDGQVGPLYGEEVRRELLKVCKDVFVYTVEAGEEHKTLDTVGDLTGCAAATYLRGIGFIQIPTTLLSQVDSSIGGKTGVDFDHYKNMVGAFHMPRLVYMNVSVIKTLSERQFASGMAEILKHGLIKDDAYYRWMLEHEQEIRDRDYKVLLPLIEKSCRIKRAVVEQDPTEQGERALLNFGHTIGHAVEKLKNFQLLHGECVAVGAVAAAVLSVNRGLMKAEDLGRIRQGCRAFGLPVSVEGLSAPEIMEATRSDKKMEAGSIRFVLLRRIGEAFTDRSVTEEELLAAIRAVLEGAEV